MELISAVYMISVQLLCAARLLERMTACVGILREHVYHVRTYACNIRAGCPKEGAF